MTSAQACNYYTAQTEGTLNRMHHMHTPSDGVNTTNASTETEGTSHTHTLTMSVQTEGTSDDVSTKSNRQKGH